MKKIAIIASVVILILVIVVVIFYSRTKIKKTDDGGVSITNEKLMSDDVSYVTDVSEVTIHRNKVTKKADVDMKYKIKDQDEYTEALGQKSTMVPFLVNATCSMLTTAVFEPEKLSQLSDADKSKEDDQMNNYLKGYTPTGFKLSFLDAETSENIASCESSQAGNNNIKFQVFRDYNNVGSILNAKIGVFDNQSSL